MNGYILLVAVVFGFGLTHSIHINRTFDPGKSAMDGSYLPTKLKVASNAFRGNNSLMVWDGNALQLEKTVGGRTTRKESFTPSEAAWKKFWKELKEIGIWKWETEYIDETIADGRYWEVSIEYGDKKIQSRGRNSYPPQFERYEKAVSELQGEKVN